MDNSLTLENYMYVFTVGWKAVKDTVMIALVSTESAACWALHRLSRKQKGIAREEGLGVYVFTFTYCRTVIGIAYAIAFSQAR